MFVLRVGQGLGDTLANCASIRVRGTDCDVHPKGFGKKTRSPHRGAMPMPAIPKRLEFKIEPDGRVAYHRKSDERNTPMMRKRR